VDLVLRHHLATRIFRNCIKRAGDSMRQLKKHVDKRTAILDATELLLVREGYAAVSTRRVAKEVRVAPPNVHYYFPTTEDLFIAVHRRACAQYNERLKRALESAHAIRELWKMHANKKRMTLGLEFIALANHRKTIRKELGKHIRAARLLQVEVLSRLLRSAGYDENMLHPLSAATTIAWMSRGLLMEQMLGITLGHSETNKMVEYWLRGIALRRGTLGSGAA
jgi:AcrR family transcriptional regulator